MSRLPIPSDTAEFDEETRAAVRHILQTRKSMPPPSSYLTYAGKATGSERPRNNHHRCQRSHDRSRSLSAGASYSVVSACSSRSEGQGCSVGKVKAARSNCPQSWP